MSSEPVDDVGLAPPARPALRAAERPAFARGADGRSGADRPRFPVLRHRELGEALRTLGRVFDTLETTQLQCSVLEAEKSASQIETEKLLENAFARIEDLEAVVAGLMKIVAKYDSLLSLSNGRRQEAEERAAQAESRIKETERGASQAVEWLYRYMSDALHDDR